MGYLGIINFLQRQPYRFTNCRCLIENIWDGFMTLAVIALAIIGILSLVDEYLEERKKRK